MPRPLPAPLSKPPRPSWGRLLLILGLLLAAHSAPAGAQGPYLDSPMVELLTRAYAPVEAIEVVTVGQNVQDKDDLLVTLFMAQAAKVDPIQINRWRKESRSWQEIQTRLGLSPDRFFVSLGQLEVPPGYPAIHYPWGQYKKWKANPSRGLVLYDRSYRELVGLDLMVRQLGWTPMQALKARVGHPSAFLAARAALGVPPPGRGPRGGAGRGLGPRRPR